MALKSCFKRVLLGGRYIVLIYCMLTAADPAYARDDSFIIELFAYGQVTKAGNSYTVGRGGGIFLKVVSSQNERCLFLEKPGVYHISRLKEKLKFQKKFAEFFKCNLSALLHRFSASDKTVVTPVPF